MIGILKLIDVLIPLCMCFMIAHISIVRGPSFMRKLGATVLTFVAGLSMMFITHIIMNVLR